MNIPQSNLPRVVIIGGGFAGVNLVKAFANKNVQVVLIDKRNYHTFQPLLYQVSSAGLEPDSIAYPLRKIIKKHKTSFFRLAQVEQILPENKEIITSIGHLSYDYLIIATGTKTNYFGNKAIESSSMPMKTVPQALNIRSLILQNFEKAAIADTEEEREAYLNFVIVGAGPTGVELAGAIAELKNNILPRDYRDLNPNDMHIHLLEGADRVLPPMSEHASKKAERFLEKLGVKIHRNTFVKHYDGTTVTTNSELKLESETLIWAAGVTGAPIQGLKAEALIQGANRYKVNQFNQIEGHTNIFAVGDIALMASEDYPKGHPQVAQPAIQQGKLLGKNLLRLIDNKPLKPFTYRDKGSMATIGRNKAVVDLKHYKFGGFFAWFVWMFVHLMSLVGFRNRVIVLFNWTYNYINFDKAARLIIRPYKK
ncbi:NADH dehydrogenase FAD-containing subunit [Winogradskyella eximia]|jgi:NADH:quinone reductase (non-electrogenic)|uniref:NADH:ubiquinone reductase (non-electrogenic) n=1 Tax=Winogradskyella eximia TaxID=262006 RepID=A0A3D9H7Z2_9FLAO|nr:NAD(P)/FAD-dependent oxidoreductase [Winogradskyella eximia]RED45615.1 NADH dehydrogenase FAD-containing subunit [Winogradskyella eximia]|tara:strand:+ start:5960 stop:7231 length:1272 start_codon:yes stop_codon:yes gene_type:complete